MANIKLLPEDCKDIRVLFAEDDETARQLTLDIFNKFFVNIDIAVDGQDGLEKAKEIKYDLIITDLNMPKLGGLDMIKAIKEFDKDIYTIIVSAYSDQDNFMNSILLGIKGYIVKPINIKQLLGVLKIAVDTINTRKHINILEQYKQIVDQTAIVSKSDLKGNISFANDKFCEISGYTKDELIGNPHNMLRDPSMNSSIFRNMWATIKDKEIWSGQIKNKKKNGDNYYVDATICPILDENGDTIEYIALRNDITELLNSKKQLTDKINTSENPILIMLKIDNFHILDHLYEETTIEDMLVLFEKLIYTYLPEGLEVDVVYNLGEGEFAILKLNNDFETSAASLEIQLKQLQKNIHNGMIVVDEYDFDISVFISFATQKENLYKNVKYGIVQAQEGKADIVFANNLTKKIREVSVKNSEIIKMIKLAISTNSIVSHFQAITNNKTMEIEKYESLVRLVDSNNKIISPYYFLDVAKDSGYYDKITHIVLQNSFAALDDTDKEISINLSALDIEDLDTRNILINLVTTNMHNAHRVVFELLEDEKIKDFEIVKDFIALVKTFGVKIAIDDFGAGVSNFERLLDYEPDILKIDACLIKNIVTDKYSRDVVETIQLFATKQNIKTVAEFVATPEILAVVKEIGIDYSQGFLLGKPEPLPNQ